MSDGLVSPLPAGHGWDGWFLDGGRLINPHGQAFTLPMIQACQMFVQMEAVRDVLYSRSDQFGADQVMHDVLKSPRPRQTPQRTTVLQDENVQVSHNLVD